jgi:hypothetical protein
VPIVRRLTIFAHGEDGSVRSLVDGIEDPLLADFFAGLDRDERSYRGGVRYYPTEELRVGAGVGHSESTFADYALDRSNSGDFWYAEVAYERPKLGVDLRYQQNQLAAVDGSGFSDFDGSTGAVRIEWRPRESFSARLYSSRQLAYSLLVDDASAYVDQLVGGGVEFGIGWRLRLNLFAETGSHRYEGAASGAGEDAVADAESFGADLSIELLRSLELRLGYQASRITPPSGSGQLRQKVSQILVNLGFGFGQGTWY